MFNCYLNKLFVNGFFITLLFFMITVMFLEVKKVSLIKSKSAVKSCSRGFRFDFKSNLCVDINECEEFKCSICPRKICQNLLGGFQCRVPQCPVGYRTDASFRRTHVNKCVRKRCQPRSGLRCRTTLPKYKTFKALHVSNSMSDLKDDKRGRFAVLHQVFMKRFGRIGVDIKIKTDECVPSDGFEILNKKKSIIVMFRSPAKTIELCARKVFATIRVIDKRNQREYERVEIEFINHKI